MKKVVIAILVIMMTLSLAVGCAKDESNGKTLPHQHETDEGLSAETKAKDTKIPRRYTASKGLEFESNDDGTCNITGLGSFEENILVIPNESSSGEKVIYIEKDAFWGMDDVESVVFSDNYLTVGSGAFSYSRLESVVVIGGEITIDKDAFNACDDLEEIEISNCDIELGNNAFVGGGDSTSIKLSESKVKIGDSTFSYFDCSSLQIVNCELIIGESAFSSCSKLATIEIENCIFETDERLFWGSGKATDLKISNSTGKLGENFFSYGACNNIVIENCDLSIGDYGLSACEKLESLIFEDSLLHIEDEAFWGSGKNLNVSFVNCSGNLNDKVFSYGAAETIAVDNSKLKIGDYAFTSCEKLTNLEIKDSELLFGDEVFWNAGYSSSVVVEGSDVQLGRSAFNYASIESISIEGKKLVVEKESFSSIEDLSSLVIDCEMVEMGKHCFYNCEELENVTIGASLHAEDGEIILNNEAFWYCSNLSEAFINGHSVTIGSDCFYSNAKDLIITVNGQTYSANNISDGLSF